MRSPDSLHPENDITDKKREEPFFSIEGIPPTLLSLIGTAAACIGIKDPTTFKGFAPFVIGSVMDALDGKLARATGGETKLGKIVDHTGDKIKVFYTIWKMYEADTAPRLVLGGIAAFNAINAACSIKTHIDNPDMSQAPEKSGKIAMAMEVVSLILYSAGKFAELHGLRKTSNTARVLGGLAAATAIIPATLSTASYIRRASGNNHNPEKHQNTAVNRSLGIAALLGRIGESSRQ